MSDNWPCLIECVRSQKDCATLPTSFRRLSNRNLFWESRPSRFSPFSSANLKASGGLPRSASATTTTCVNCSAPNRSPPGWRNRCKRRDSSEALQPGSEQVLCTEYDVGVGIGWHRDKPHFDEIFGLSLGSACKFRFRKRAGKSWDRFTIDAEPRSLYMMTGASRQIWEHSIPAVEAPRYSITFRTMTNGPDPRTPA